MDSFQALNIAACISVAVSGYENEVIKILSRTEKNNSLPKQSELRTPPATRRQRELWRLEYGANYDRTSTSTRGMLVPYV